MRKLLTIIATLLILAFIFNRYSYLVTSYRNWPNPSTPASTSVSYPSSSSATSDPSLSFLNLPPGFAINYFAKDVPGARSLTSNTDGSVLYVGTRNPGVVYALEGNTRYTVASVLNSPNGVAYLDGDLYVAEINRIIKFPNIDQNYQNSPSYELVYAQLPTDTHHGWRYLAVGPDNRLYLGIGAPCNVCEVQDPYASIVSFNPDGSDFRVEARGIRNTIGITWAPDGQLWFTDNGRDGMGDDIPPDELNRLDNRGQDFGFPSCHGRVGDCTNTTPPVAELGPHVAALGLLFYQGEMFPAEYKNKIIIAEHGSWNRTDPIGYRLTTVDVSGSSASNYQPFVDGWLGQDGKALGRPVDLLELPDGSLLISDDLGGSIYRLTYTQ